ncbi:MAG: DinB family protein [Myroides sp.]|jgi:hypothetical protein|nr:DinB family protein [Myroides sp.]
MTNQEVLDELLLLTDKHIQQLQLIKQLTEEHLRYSPSVDQWNILQCMEHLNHYFDFYLPQFTTASKLSSPTPEKIFKPGFIGNYFANMLVYKENQKKISSPKPTNPIGKEISMNVITTFENNLVLLKDTLNSISPITLNTKHITTMFSNWYKLKVGDGLRIVIYHNDRHFHQMNKLIPSKL